MDEKKKKLNKFFRELRKAGYYAKQNHACCMTCGVAEIPDDVDKYVFYHMQDAYYMKESGQVNLAWGGDGKEICDIAKSNDLYVKWNGKPTMRIMVKL